MDGDGHTLPVRVTSNQLDRGDVELMHGKM